MKTIKNIFLLVAIVFIGYVLYIAYLVFYGECLKPIKERVMYEECKLDYQESCEAMVELGIDEHYKAEPSKQVQACTISSLALNHVLITISRGKIGK